MRKAAVANFYFSNSLLRARF